MKDLKTLIKDHDLMNHYDEIVKITKKMIRIKTEKSDDQSIKIGESKMGGDPDLPEDFQWPYWNEEPLTLLIQVNLSEMNRFSASKFLPKEGMLYFFYDHNQSTFGFDIDDKGSWKVIYSKSKSQELKRISNPVKDQENNDNYNEQTRYRYAP